MRRAQRARRNAARPAQRRSYQRELLLDTMVAEHAGRDAARRPRPAHRARQHRARASCSPAAGASRAVDFAELLARVRRRLREAIERGGDGLFSRRARRRCEETLPPRASASSRSTAAARAVRAAPAHARAAPPGSADVEEGDPRDQPRAQQLARAGRVARALGARAGRGAAKHAAAATRSSRRSSERARHLKHFIEGYARFAKLPAPRHEPVAVARAASTGCARRSRSSVEGALPERARLLRSGAARAGARQPAEERARVRLAARDAICASRCAAATAVAIEVRIAAPA